MTTVGDWVEGARLRTLPAAFSPVLAGTGAALAAGSFRPVNAVLALVVSLALQVGVNYANDYSDGIRGTDSAERVGPQRLVGSGAAPAATVKRAAFLSFGVAGLAGLALVILTQQWWLLLVGVACVLAAWYYTGGKHPYGYLGLGEVFVFVFFGLVAVCGTTYVQLSAVTLASLFAAVAIGALACAILVTNNLRDIDTDVVSGKRTLETRLGDRGSRVFFVALLALAGVAVVAVSAASGRWWSLLGLAFVLPLAAPTRSLLSGASGLALVRVLKLTGIAELLAALGLLIGLSIPA
ncbi:1,4-dihydroxy-2-naphthoate polyprenyltransferase [Raineyella fluvialis]|uniref:1,4-dihydroxy-2-naphthoate octaprenyltransferase n=1 Tax=Raineyella fluvialis TaxID=2662261 RepID=A0A5Q2FAQ8_9ACTN|nr:1,4-dihydroxy-2-naphthoate polyprenyltransferase [Raineyella fluvialis]QGF22807.1 1,4-dihydroxy-2-naphthoate polyprenyltransferase [Raineyella fluvialis]